MSIALSSPLTQTPAIFRSSSATVSIPVPTSTVRVFNASALFPNERNLLLGASLLNDDPVFSAFFQEVKALQNDEEEDAPPDSRALAETLRLVPFSRSQLAQRWQVPRIASDGFGGLRLTWTKGTKEVRAVIAGAQTMRCNYIYWEDSDGYETVPNFTAATLLTYLERLEKVAPLER